MYPFLLTLRLSRYNLFYPGRSLNRKISVFQLKRELALEATHLFPIFVGASRVLFTPVKCD